VSQPGTKWYLLDCGHWVDYTEREQVVLIRVTAEGTMADGCPKCASRASRNRKHEVKEVSDIEPTQLTVKPDPPPNRRTGQTTRVCFRALLAASETERADIVIIVPDRHRVQHESNALWGFARLIGGSTRNGWSVELCNGSRIRVLPMEHVYKLEGTKPTKLLHDIN
jgi:hypothetical protein